MISADPQLAAQIQAIIDHPLAAQRPDLVHFRPVAATTASWPHGGAGGAGSSSAAATSAGAAPPLLAALAAVALLAFAVVSGARLMARPAYGGAARWRSLRTLAAACGAVSLATWGLSEPASIHVVTPSVAAIARASGGSENVAAAGGLAGALRTHSLAVPVGSCSRTWTSLVSIEASVTGQQDRVVADERQIAGMTRVLSAQADGPALQSALARVVDDHQQAMAAYNASLQNEYSFFVSTAQSPQATQELQSVVVHVPPLVRSAVATDLNIVQTQLQQEVQIAAAQAAATPDAPTGAIAAPSRGPIDAQALAQRTALQFHAPVGGVITQPFGPTSFALEPPITYAGTFYPHFHTGLDIAAPLDTPVGASAAGTVILAASSVDSTGQLAGYGNYVVIAEGDGFETLYGHLDKLLVSTGESVQQGQVVGLLGSTGWSTGPHLHFEIRKEGVYVDPAPFLASALHH